MSQNTQNSITSELTDEDLERYLLGRIHDQADLSQIETHLRSCPVCAERTQEMTGSIFVLIKALQQLEMHGADNSGKLDAVHCINRSWSPKAQHLPSNTD